MTDLKKLFGKMGFTNIQTYIQSGNVIFDSKEESESIELADKIEQSVAENYGFEVPVIIRTVKDLNEAISNNPFFGENKSDVERLHLTFLRENPKPENLAKIEDYDYSSDKFEINGKNVFICCSGKYSDSKLTNKFFENKLKVSATTRNWKTVLKLSELSETQKV